jgi:hypothetical protein
MGVANYLSEIKVKTRRKLLKQLSILLNGKKKHRRQRLGLSISLFPLRGRAVSTKKVKIVE